MIFDLASRSFKTCLTMFRKERRKIKHMSHVEIVERLEEELPLRRHSDSFIYGNKTGKVRTRETIEKQLRGEN